MLVALGIGVLSLVGAVAFLSVASTLRPATAEVADRDTPKPLRYARRT